MMKHLLSILSVFIFTLGLSAHSYGQIPVSGSSENKALPWHAKWIAANGDNGVDCGVYYFRKEISLDQRPEAGAFKVHVSADNRYKLFVNDSLVSLGPVRGDLYYWNYETVDLSPFLTSGKNVIAAQVWNEAQNRPEAQITLRTGFIMQGANKVAEVLNTDKSWKAVKDLAFTPLPGYFAASTGQTVDLNKTIMDWHDQDFDDSQWKPAAELFGGNVKGNSDGFGWMLVPTNLPPMEMTYQRIPVLREAKGMKMPATFPGTKSPVTIPANSTVDLLLDQTFLTNAYFTLDFNKGKDATISIGYAESLFDDIQKYGMRKSNRNEVAGKDFSGRMDSLIANGQTGQSFTTLNFRTYRYIHLVIRTKSEPLVLTDIYGTFTGYPFRQNAEFNSANQEITKILDIGWRTARLNAFETYTDCPYYEQLQYIGDTRIQAMISYYYSGDDRLARNALNLMDHSRLTEGVTLSRYPTHSTQIIPTFSLWYIGMLHDYWMYRDDPKFVQQKLAGVRAVLGFFQKYQGEDGSLKNVPYWNFVDWASGEGWFVGAPPIGPDGSSAILDLQLLRAYQWAGELEEKLGRKGFSTTYQEKAAQLKRTIQKKYWDPDKGLYSDVSDKTHFSQHVNSMAILAGMIKKSDLPVFGDRILKDSSLTQCTIYFKYYLHKALVKAGLGNQYLSWLDVWRNNIKMGLTTWAETSDLHTTRSDCHAWGSSPNIEFFRTVLGIDSDAPGFSQIKIEPHLGQLTKVDGEIPHPNGKVTAAYALEKGKWHIKLTLPTGTKGTFIWEQKSYPLKSGLNTFVL